MGRRHTDPARAGHEDVPTRWPRSVRPCQPPASRHHVDLNGAPLRTTLTIAGMDRPTEEALIRSKLAGMAGVTALDFNLVQRRLSVTHRPGRWMRSFRPEVPSASGSNGRRWGSRRRSR